MLTREVIRKAIPEASDELCHDILWERTPFPMGKVTARSLYKAADRLRRANANGRQLCELCDNVARPGKFDCQSCDAAMRQLAA
jgi:hypothetical protein